MTTLPMGRLTRILSASSIDRTSAVARDQLRKLAEVMDLAAIKARVLSDTGKADGRSSEVSAVAAEIDKIATRLRDIASRLTEADPTAGPD